MAKITDLQTKNWIINHFFTLKVQNYSCIFIVLYYLGTKMLIIFFFELRIFKIIIKWIEKHKYELVLNY